uniref:Enoyl-CoA hydratase domain-containing protein 3, mitochondrial n=1 Tax=Rhabditophanes sp. KR3021 TaxID=114890 RepID=A0AC35THX9_9BILA
MSFSRLILSKSFLHPRVNLITRPLSSAAPDDIKTDDLVREIYHGNSTVRLVMNSTKDRNALSLKMLNLLYDELFYINKIKKVRSVIIAGNGPAFSAGHNLKELVTEKGIDHHKEVFARCTQLMTLIQSMQVPIIAEVDGVAAAAGLQLALSADILIASDKSTFSVPGIKAGLFCHTPGVALLRNVPHKIGMGMLLTGKAINAEEALRAGMVTKITTSEQVKFEALEYAEAINQHSKTVVALGKTFAHAQIGLKQSDAYRYAESVMVENLKLQDTQEGLQAFVEKRDPIYTHNGLKMGEVEEVEENK